MTVVRVLSVLLIAALAEAAKPPLCTTGRFLVPAPNPPLFTTSRVSGEVVLDPGPPPMVAIRGSCPPVVARLKATRRGTIVRASWPFGACGVTGRVRFKAAIVDVCQTLTGTLRRPSVRPITFVAPRCAQDGVVSVVDGEECDGEVGCPAGFACSPNCRCVGLPPPTTVPTTTRPTSTTVTTTTVSSTTASPTTVTTTTAPVPSTVTSTTFLVTTTASTTTVSTTTATTTTATSTVTTTTEPTTTTTGTTTTEPPPTTTTTTTATTTSSTTTTDCATLCGNGVRDAACGEACDGDDLGGATCPGGSPEGAFPGDCQPCLPTCQFDPACCAVTTTTLATTTTSTTTTTTTTTTRPSTTTTRTSTTTIRTTTSTTIASVSYQLIVQPILMLNCLGAGCHSGAAPALGLDLTVLRAYTSLTQRNSVECPPARLVVPGSPETSALMRKLTGTTCGFTQMPLLRPPLPADQIKAITTWIAQGALNN